MGKIVAYFLLLIGIILLVLNFAPVKTALNITIPESIKPIYLSVAGTVLVVTGIIFMFKGKSGGRLFEVPIYEGKKIIGYRRK